VLAKRGCRSRATRSSTACSSANRSGGLLQACQELGVTLIAYSPLRKGLLTGKYSVQKPPPGTRGRLFRGNALAAAETVNALLKEIGEAHGGKTNAQVALNWLICKAPSRSPVRRTLARQSRTQVRWAGD